ncbi:DNA topology modulation protein [Jeotgalibacillus soli]|uniref:Topology modulation protein n=1 Tax=Jeotgalibacillus soli TaxID=889306 RepID=A0A0C2W689_9BACL|nr:DNA topology modulation protein [Jeotgalibacillus soli]KIL52086.1 hypothetical protein KP78_04560 [Jeotgalibacillus soli]
MQKIIIIGSGGAGKSTLSKQLGEQLQIPVYHLDALFWNPGWTPSLKSYFQEKLLGIMKKEQWIMDGNFGSTMDLRIKEADTVIFLNYSRWLCLARAIKRRITYHGKTRPDMGEGCPEKLDLDFLRWIWHYPDQKAPRIFNKLEGLKNEKNIIILSSPKETKKWLQQMRPSSI